MIECITKSYQKLVFFGGLLKSPILLLSRLYWGSLFAIAGWEKLGGVAHFAQFLHTHHFPFPLFMAYLAALVELIGGVCLVLGFASRLASIPLTGVMIVAYSTIHMKALDVLFCAPGVFVAEAPFNFLLTSLLVLAFGPGRFSVDYLFEKSLFGRAEEIPKHQHKP